MQEANQQRKEKEQAATVRRVETEEITKTKVDQIRVKGQDKWNLDNCRVMVSWFKRPGDSKIPNTKASKILSYLSSP